MRSDLPFRYRIKKCLPLLPIFEFIRQQSQLSYFDLFQIFNCGAGMAIFVPTLEDAEMVVSVAAELQLNAIVAGNVEGADSREVLIEPYDVQLSGDLMALKK